MLQVSKDKLNLLAHNLRHKYYSINYGGCAFIAQFMYCRLKGNCDNVRIAFIRHGNTQEKYNNAMNNTKYLNAVTLRENGIGWDHAVVMFDINEVTHVFDVDLGVVPLSIFFKETHWNKMYVEIEYDVVRVLTSRPLAWNSDFPRWQAEEIERDILASCVYNRS